MNLLHKFVVLGGGGLIGRNLCEMLRKRGHDVFNVDIKNGAEQDLVQISLSELTEIIDHADFVFFAAFEIGGSKYLSDAERGYSFINTNLRLMTNCFDALRLTGKPFVFLSSQMVEMPWSNYGVLKRIGEAYAQALGSGISVRLWNVYGEEEPDERSHVITDFVYQSVLDGKIHILTTGLEKRQFLHVDDCCAALYRIASLFNQLKAEGSRASIDLTSFQWTEIRSVAAIVRKFRPTTFIRVGDGCDDVQRACTVEPEDFVLSFWKPQISLEEGISRYIRSVESKNG